jgi:hypothetical protein
MLLTSSDDCASVPGPLSPARVLMLPTSSDDGASVRGPMLLAAGEALLLLTAEGARVSFPAAPGAVPPAGAVSRLLLVSAGSPGASSASASSRRGTWACPLIGAAWRWDGAQPERGHAWLIQQPLRDASDHIRRFNNARERGAPPGPVHLPAGGSHAGRCCRSEPAAAQAQLGPARTLRTPAPASLERPSCSGWAATCAESTLRYESGEETAERCAREQARRDALCHARLDPRPARRRLKRQRQHLQRSCLGRSSRDPCILNSFAPSNTAVVPLEWAWVTF